VLYDEIAATIAIVPVVRKRARREWMKFAFLPARVGNKRTACDRHVMNRFCARVLLAAGILCLTPVLWANSLNENNSVIVASQPAPLSVSFLDTKGDPAGYSVDMANSAAGVAVPRPYDFLFTSNSRVILQQINEGIALAGETGALRNVSGEWLATLELSPNSGYAIPGYLGLGAGLLLILLALSVFWNLSLKRRLDQRTRLLSESEKRFDSNQHLAAVDPADNTLESMENGYVAVLASTTDAAVAVDLDGRITVFNPGAEKLFGCTADDALGTPVTRFFPEERLDEQSEMMRRAQEEGVLEGYESERLTADGRRVPVEITLSRSTDDRGRLLGFNAILRDIPERKEAEQALRESEEKFRGIYEQTPLAIQIYDLNGTLLDVNQQTLDLFGIEDIKYVRDFNFWEDPNLSPDKRKVLEKGQPVLISASFDFEMTGKLVHFPTIRTGKIFLDMYMMPMRQNNEIIGYIVQIIEVTERKESEETLRKSEDRLKEAQSIALVGNFESDFEKGSFWWSDEAFKIMGYEKSPVPPSFEEIITRIAEEDRQRVKDLIEGSVKHGKDHSATFKYFTPVTNEVKYLHSIANVSFDENNKPKEFKGTIQDITERKMAEVDRERLLHDMGERTKELTCMYGVSELIRKREKLTQVFEDVVELIPSGWQYPGITRCRIRFDDQEYTSQLFDESKWQQNADIMARGQRRGLVDVFYLEVCPEMDEGPFLKEERDLIDGIARMLSEAIEHDQVEKERMRLTHAIGQAAEAIVITDSDAVIQYVNPAFEQISGYAREEIIGQNPGILKSGRLDDKFYRQMWDTLTSGETWSGRLINKKKDGTLFTEEAVISPVLDEAGRIINYVAVKRDITSELVLDSQLRQAQKMEAVGRLAGGVAHDFNNMLSIIIGHTDMILEQTDSSQPIHPDLQEIKKAGERSADLTRQLLAFARKQTVAPRVIDLNETLAGMTNMLQRLIGEDIDFAWFPGEDVWPVRIDPSQIDQILANLCVNARDAIADVGKVTIETGNARFDEVYCDRHLGTVPGEYVMLAVSDNGCGMDAETRVNLFEPFFTTKESGKGTGLGLSTVFGVVKQNNGFISVYSEPGQGTTFKIYLPRHLTALERVSEKGSEKPIVGGHETVLLVEDEPSILKLATRMLEGEGYTVMAADTPDEAIRLAKEHGGDIHLLMTDVVMPEMNGRDLARKILSLYPDMKSLFMSGYTSNVIAHHGVLDDGVRFIPKPFSKRELTAKLREVLD
jgi:PAS domain S-box-containing protein